MHDGCMSQVYANVGSAFDTSTRDRFVAPQAGIYFFSMSGVIVGQTPAVSYALVLVINGVKHCGGRPGSSQFVTQGAVDMFSRSCLVSLQAGDKVTLNNDMSQPITSYDGGKPIITWQGFFYSQVASISVRDAVDKLINE
jgi:hypothetical protein